jgi:phospholipid/cholesterol/gamma-HCH transport system substrate-binding protein
VIVSLWLKSNVRVKEDSKFYITSLGLMDERYVEITSGTVKSKPLAPNSMVKGEEPILLSQILERGEKITISLKETIDSIEQITNVDKGSLRRTFTNLEDATLNLKNDLKNITRRLDSFAENLNKLSQHGTKDLNESFKQIRQTTSDLRESLSIITNEMEKLSKSLNRLVDTKKDIMSESIDNFKKASSALRSSSIKLKGVLGSLEKILIKIEKGEGTLGMLIMDDEIAINLKKASSDIKDLAEDLKKHPWKLLRKK